jgi:hypothetical protein
MFDLYKYIDRWNGEFTFRYIAIVIVCLWLFSLKKIGINILIAILFLLFLISYLNNREIEKNATVTDTLNKMKNEIIPKMDNGFKYDEIVYFLFSIQDMYQYNPLQYIDMVNNLELFFKSYDLSKIDITKSAENYQFMEQRKRDSLNALQSMIIQLPTDRRVIKKFHTAVSRLDELLTGYLDHVSYLVDNNLYINGYDVDTKIINYGAKPFNQYDDIFAPYTYEVY